MSTESEELINNKILLFKAIDPIRRMSGRHHISSPIPIPSNGEPTELQRLISLKNQWTAVIERCTTHPHEVGSSTNLRNDKGYTALHTVTAYNHATHGDVLVQ